MLSKGFPFLCPNPQTSGVTMQHLHAHTARGETLCRRIMREAMWTLMKHKPPVTNIFDFRSAKMPRLRQMAALFAVFSVTGCMSADFHDYVFVGINVVKEAPDMKPVDKKLTEDAAVHLNNKSNVDGDLWRKAC